MRNLESRASARWLERVVDAREDCCAFAAPSYVHEADYERLCDPADSDAADRVHVRERIVAHFMADAARFRKRRQLEYAVRAQHVLVPYPGADFEVHHEQIVVDIAAGAVTAQRFLIGEQALVTAQARLRPKRDLVTRRLV